MSDKQYRPLRVFVTTDDLDALHRKLAEREAKTRDVSKWLEARAAIKVFPSVQVALPVPVGKPEVLMLWLRVFRHLRSPTYVPKYPRRFRPDTDSATIDRCRSALEEMLAVCRMSASTRGEWSEYISAAIALLTPDPLPEWAVREAKANAARWDKY